MSPLGPTHTDHLLAPLHAELVALLRELAPSDWGRPTVAGDWRVRDVVAHLLDGDLRVLSALRDGHEPEPAEPIGGDADLVAHLDRLNAAWVGASRRLSPRVLTDLVEAVGAEAAHVLAALPSGEPARYAVAWAGEAESPNWMHVGREYTERWHHQAQVRDAVGAAPLTGERWMRPFLEVSLRALPHAYRAVEAPEGTSVGLDVEKVGAWSLVREGDGWALTEGASTAPAAAVGLDADTAWRTLYHALEADEARRRAAVDGDEALVRPFFEARSVMV